MGNGDTLDVSGSMSGSRIIMDKKALIQLIQKLNDENNITISKFNNKSEQVFPYQKVSDLKKTDYISELEKCMQVVAQIFWLLLKELIIQ